MSEPCRGVAASSGYVVAPAIAWEPDGAVEVEPAVDIDDAARLVVEDLRSRAARATSPEGAQVLDALALIAADPELLAAARRRAGDGEDPAKAIRAAADDYADQLRGLGGYLAERAPDVEDIGSRLADRLEGRASATLPQPGHPFVLVARDLAPADTALLDPQQVVGIVTEQGGPTSHTTILARSLGIPAVVACPGARAALDGRVVLLDGSAGVVRVDPAEEEVILVREREHRKAERLAHSHGPGRTADGVAVPVLANIGSVEDALVAAEAGVEGIGLFRTELLYLGRTEEPSYDEQVETYARVLAAFAGRRVVFRTLDAGSDKPIPFLGLPDEENPALGVRGLRTSKHLPDVLDRQLRALAEAGQRTSNDPWVMAPMVSTGAEAAAFATDARAAGLTRVGVMVEVPAAALRSRHLLRHVDFASLGTNDLAQYALAADRQLGDVAELLDPWQPALLDLVAAACDGAGDAPVGVCGEAATDVDLAAVLVGLGVRSLSVTRKAVDEVRASIAEIDLPTCVAAAAAARSAEGPQEARELVRAVLGR